MRTLSSTTRKQITCAARREFLLSILELVEFKTGIHEPRNAENAAAAFAPRQTRFRSAALAVGVKLQRGIKEVMRRCRYAQFVTETCDRAGHPLEFKAAAALEVYLHRRFVFGRHVIEEGLLPRQIVGAEIDALGLGNRNGLRDGIGHELTRIGIAEDGAGRFARHAAHSAERGQERELCPHLSYDGRRQCGVDAGLLAGREETLAAGARAAAEFAEDDAGKGPDMRDNTGRRNLGTADVSDAAHEVIRADDRAQAIVPVHPIFKRNNRSLSAAYRHIA